MRQTTSQTAENTVTLAEVTTAITERIAALGETLKEAVRNQNDPETLKRILGSLRSDNGATTTPERPAIEVAYVGQFSELEVRPGLHGKREVQFTLRGGLDNLEAACNEINEAMKGASNYPEAGFKVYLSGNNDLPRGEDITVTYTPVIKDSGNRVRFGSDPAQSHKGLLNSLGLGFVNNDLHRLACGALRVIEGFPKDSNQIGSTTDKGDLNEGKVVRTEKGSRSGAVYSFLLGVGGRDWHDASACGFVVVAGAAPRNPATP